MEFSLSIQTAVGITPRPSFLDTKNPTERSYSKSRMFGAFTVRGTEEMTHGWG